MSTKDIAADPAVLRELLERVRAAKGPDREIDVKLECLFQSSYAVSSRPGRRLGAVISQYPERHGTWTARRITASIDAALALVERVLPGAIWERNSEGVITIWHDFATPSHFMPYRAEQNSETRQDDNQAVTLAILAALLSALIARAEAAHV